MTRPALLAASAGAAVTLTALAVATWIWWHELIRALVEAVKINTGGQWA